MKTITKKYKVFAWSELSDQAREKAREAISKWNLEDGFWADDESLLEPSQKQLDNAGIKFIDAPKNWNTLSDYDKKRNPYYWQYAGLFKFKDKSYDLDRGQYLTFHRLLVTDGDIFRCLLGIPNGLWERISYNIKEPRESNNEIEFENQSEDEFTDEENAILEDAKETFSDMVYAAWKNLRANYEYQYTEEACKDTAEANDVQFLEDGTIFRG